MAEQRSDLSLVDLGVEVVENVFRSELLAEVMHGDADVQVRWVCLARTWNVYSLRNLNE